MAFLVCVEFSVYGALRKLLYCVPSPLNAALVASSEHCILLSIVIDSAARGESLTFCC